MDNLPRQSLNVLQAPSFCAYVKGPCDQDFSTVQSTTAVFLYPSQPEIIASTVEDAVERLQQGYGESNWLSWKNFGVSGQIIFCEISKAIRFTKIVVADVTTLNFNLLFEIGYAIGLNKAILPIRDSNFIQDKKSFDELGLLDTFGFHDFQNSKDLVQGVLARKPIPFTSQLPAINKEQPIYLIKSHVQTDGMIRLISTLKKSALRFRTFDPKETPRLSLHEAFKQVHSSLGVVVHLLNPNRAGATVHNARCAFVAGLAMAAGKNVLMLQESNVEQPIDYRDVVRSYSHSKRVPELVIPFIREVVSKLQDARFVPTALPLKLLEKLDMGDLAAENEIKALRDYFVPTGQYNEAKRGRARLVVGRKGAGKTAIFYGVRSAYLGHQGQVVLDLKPEGHQFTKLREFVLNELSPGYQQQVLTAFWGYLLLLEIAHKIVNDDEFKSYQNQRLRNAFTKLEDAYGRPKDIEQGDFSERLLELVDSIVSRKETSSGALSNAEITQLIYTHDLRVLTDALSEYLIESKKKDVWLLFDNLDKGWPIQAVKDEDIFILKSLLEATRKLQRQFEMKAVEFHSVVFIRNDIYQHLLLDPADRGKDTAVILDWNDTEMFREIIRRRMIRSTEMEGNFRDLWPLFFETHIKEEESFAYILRHTLMRPREVIRFVRECLDVAVNRGHEKVKEEDVLYAEQIYSEDALVDLTLELGDVRPAYADVPYGFIGAEQILSQSEVVKRLSEAGIPADEHEKVLELLLWFGFLGVFIEKEDEERYSYKFQYNLKKMKAGVSTPLTYCIHPAFRQHLGASH